MKIKNLTIMVFGAILILTGCSSNMSTKDSASNQQGMTEQISDVNEVTTETAESDGGENISSENNLTSSNETAATKVSANNQKLIKDVSLQAETKTFDELLDCINQTIEKLDGYTETSEITGSSYEYENNRYANLKVRIPSNKLNQFVLVVKDNANITNKSESTTDVTLKYVDMESHVSALRTEQESLLTILEAATKLDDIIKVQSQLTQVRYEIESYESQLRTYDNLVSYSTITLEINEVSRETKVETKSFLENIKSRLSDNLYKIGQGFQGFIIWFISSVPYFLIWACILVPCFLILRKLYKKFLKK